MHFNTIIKLLAIKFLGYIFKTIIFLIISIPAYSQNDILEKKITVFHSNMTIENIIIDISKTYEIGFSYKNDIAELKKYTSINVKNSKLKKILSKLFLHTNIRYICYANQIILIEAEHLPQKIIIEGTIKDTENCEKIPYATVMSIKSGAGIIADIKGRFELEITDNEYNDTLKFASFTYTAKKIPIKFLLKKNNPEIFLNKKIFPIDEVKIRSKDYFIQTSGNRGSISFGSLYMDTHGQQTAIFVENKKKQAGRIIKISFRLSGKGNTDAPFRVRIYGKNTNSEKPGKDLLKDMIVVKPDIKSGWYEIDVSSYYIPAPKEGFFIAMEGVFPNDFNYYFGEKDFTELSPQDDGSKNIEIPELSYGQRLCYNRKGINKTWHYSLSHTWFQIDKKYFNVMIKTKIQYKKK